MAAALAEVIDKQCLILEEAIKEQWLDRSAKSGYFIFKNIDINHGNINYPIAAT
ncbi:MAG: hypothetical protein K9J12_10780 [Melioribacteraceae bacterium]|nr:hypothetical protein [Melioribacteraceae bacterium]MCF8265894.1 hypothetical protein [Melioribacteraceae bacterium]MCF8414340.1 hypothetical protein [Melioribacteraceae bacterium]MCF8432711.1 hypothetical protein [Melioribacteraceae bacterium]